MRAWLGFVDQVTTPAGRYPSFQYGGLLLKYRNMSAAEFAEKAAKRPLKAAFYNKMDRKTGFAGAMLDEAFADIRKSAARMDWMLQESGGPWLLGQQYTLADIAVAPLLDRQEDLGLEFLWEENHPAVADWLRRIQARPAYREAYTPGSRLSDQHPDLGLGRGTRRHLLDPATEAASG